MTGEKLDSMKPNYGPTTHVLISQMPDIDFHVVTLTPREREIHTPIEYSDFTLEKRHIKQAVDKFISILNG